MMSAVTDYGMYEADTACYKINSVVHGYYYTHTHTST